MAILLTVLKLSKRLGRCCVEFLYGTALGDNFTPVFRSMLDSRTKTTKKTRFARNVKTIILLKKVKPSSNRKMITCLRH